ncbi:hypothetical protein Mapa_003202 [Marchantia paleacea]|nr:hypothetical protein Mapa_003202 [Marchantia paleacea]
MSASCAVKLSHRGAVEAKDTEKEDNYIPPSRNCQVWFFPVTNIIHTRLNHTLHAPKNACTVRCPSVMAGFPYASHHSQRAQASRRPSIRRASAFTVSAVGL